MSEWRREASRQLPEFQSIIASKNVDGPMMLWIELQIKFSELCRQEPPPLDLLKRMWKYATWCMEHGHPDVLTAAALGFCEHLIDSTNSMDLLPRLMSRSDYLGTKELLLYHNTLEKYEEGLKRFS